MHLYRRMLVRYQDDTKFQTLRAIIDIGKENGWPASEIHTKSPKHAHENTISRETKKHYIIDV